MFSFGWARILLTAAALIALSLAPAWSTQPLDAAQTSDVRVPQSDSGQFIVPARINGALVSLVVDTGASQVVLTYEDALRAGIKLTPEDFTQGAATANGTTRFASVMLSAVAVGPVQRDAIPALVAERGALRSSLLGMTFLSRLSRVGTRDGVLVLSN